MILSDELKNDPEKLLNSKDFEDAVKAIDPTACTDSLNESALKDVRCIFKTAWELGPFKLRQRMFESDIDLSRDVCRNLLLSSARRYRLNNEGWFELGLPEESSLYKELIRTAEEKLKDAKLKMVLQLIEAKDYDSLNGFVGQDLSLEWKEQVKIYIDLKKTHDERKRRIFEAKERVSELLKDLPDNNSLKGYEGVILNVMHEGVASVQQCYRDADITLEDDFFHRSFDHNKYIYRAVLAEIIRMEGGNDEEILKYSSCLAEHTEAYGQLKEALDDLLEESPELQKDTRMLFYYAKDCPKDLGEFLKGKIDLETEVCKKIEVLAERWNDLKGEEEPYDDYY